MKTVWVLLLAMVTMVTGSPPPPPTSSQLRPPSAPPRTPRTPATTAFPPTPNTPPTNLPSTPVSTTSSPPTPLRREYPTIPRPAIGFPNPSWATHPCAQTHCATDYNRCVKLFYGDGCSCYPGLLGCAINACTTNNDEYASVLDMCYDSLQVDGRCALQCYPGYFPVDIAAVLPSEINATSPSSSNHSFVDNGDDETIREPVSVTWTVLATWSLTNTTAIDVKNSSSAFVDTLVEFLQTSYTSTLSAANVTLHLVSKSPTLQEVSAVVHVESLAALNATDRALESLLLDTINRSDDRGDGNDFGGKLVEADVIRHTTQFNTHSVKIQVIATGTNGNWSNNINATTPPALHKPTNNNANDQTILGLTPGMLLVLAAAGTALLALIIVCLCMRCRKKSSAGQDEASAATVSTGHSS